jgi:carboxyl-terminal processing protease
MLTRTRSAPVLLLLVACGAVACSSEDPAQSSATGQTTSGSGGSGGSGGGGGGGPPFTGCEGTTEAHASFNAFWSGFDETYALFDIRLPDASWGDLGRATCATIGPDTAGDALFDLLLGMARNLDDGHVQLDAPELGRDEDALVSVYPYETEVAQLEGNVEASYLDGALTYAAEDEFAWGTIGTIGYVSITSLDELSASGDEDDDRQAASEAMAAAMADLAGTTGMVIDVRANGGGWDSVALDIAALFAGDSALAWSKQRRNGPEHDDFSEWEDVYVAASAGNAYMGDVVLLTSGSTFSAAETFALAMRVRDRVTILGERTSGHFSDLYEGVLPNGWIYQLSGERYRAADMMIYETLGVPVDVAVPFDVQALATGQDVMLEAALAQLAQ